ncbi:MAG: hypothetical protein HY870_22125 [Chloroflexi bacterium]|nr:hypothetical protein [Chloroflexota bacterium]
MANSQGKFPRQRAFVIRAIFDDQGALHGQLSEPGSADEWRLPFAGADELWAVLRERLASPPNPLSQNRPSTSLRSTQDAISEEGTRKRVG